MDKAAEERRDGVMSWTLVVIWETGEKQMWDYRTEEEARAAERGMRIANGNQISWTSVFERFN